MTLYDILIFFSAISFIYYSVNSIFSKRLINEYQRWGYDKLRYLIAFLQFFAAIGFIVGFFFTPLITIVSFLLFLMMVVAVFTRLRVKDNLIETSPAIFYAILNLIIFYYSIIW